MRAWEIQDTFGIDSLSITEKPEPEPGPGQVAVRVRAVSLNYRDLQVVKGQYDPKMPLPRIPFSDGAGEVVAVGEGVTRMEVGDRVAGIFMQEWVEGGITPEKAASALGGRIDGMLREYAVLDESGLVSVPEHLSYEEAATLPCAAVTAWNALVTRGGLSAGETVLLQGTGGVSIFALQFAGMFGARAIVTSSSDEKLEKSYSLGASDGINYRETPEWDEKVLELTGGRGVDYVVEVGGPGTLNKSLSAVRMGGYVAMIGVLTGGGGEITTASILRKSIHIQGIYVGSRTMFEAMNRAISLHELKPVVDRIFDFEEAPDALRHMESGAHFGKICLRI